MTHWNLLDDAGLREKDPQELFAIPNALTIFHLSTMCIALGWKTSKSTFTTVIVKLINDYTLTPESFVRLTTSCMISLE